MLLRKIERAGVFLKFLYAQRVRGLTPPENAPHFDPPGARRFKAELAKASAYLEFGSGGSTLAADAARIPTVTIESDRFYADVVRSRLTGSLVKILTPRMGLTSEWGSPVFSSSAKGRRYVEAPFPLSPFPDFILVDGRYRVACALECARQANLAGKRAVLMFDDYVSRPAYHRVEEKLGKPECEGEAAFFTIGDRSISQASVVAATRDKM